MRRLRILALLTEGEVPPETEEELHGEDEFGPRYANFDLIQALRDAGHEVRCIGVFDELAPIRHSIEEFQPHIAFNQVLEFHGAPLYDAHVVSYLELLKQPYTGCNPRGILLASDKTLSKKILHYHRVRTPSFMTVRRGRTTREPRGLEYPLFVKSTVEHASLGISQASVVRDFDGLRERVAFVHEQVGSDAIVEEYVAGRELTVGVIGNQRLTTLPVWEMTFSNLPEGTEPIATSNVKWNRKYQKKIGVETGPAKDLAPEVAQAIERMAKRVFRVLGMSGFARIDLRMSADGRVYVLEANPNPDLTLGEDFASSAAATGLDYGALLQRIVNLGLRYQHGWKTKG